MHGTDPYIPRKGDIGLTQIHGRVGAGIRFAQFLAGGGFWDYEHAFVVVKDTYTPEPMIIECQQCDVEDRIAPNAPGTSETGMHERLWV